MYIVLPGTPENQRGGLCLFLEATGTPGSCGSVGFLLKRFGYHDVSLTRATLDQFASCAGL